VKSAKQKTESKNCMENKKLFKQKNGACYRIVSFGLSAFSFKHKKVALRNGTPNTG